MLRDPTQAIAACIIEQVAQVTLLRVVLPWMIGRAFDEITKQMPFAKSALTSMFEQVRPDGEDLGGADEVGQSARRPAATASPCTAKEPAGLLHRGAARYQILVPSYTVMFAFFLVLTVGWLFVAERRQGTMLRLRAAPLSRGADPARQDAAVLRAVGRSKA